MQVNKVCPCGKKFSVHKCREFSAVYCSRLCRVKYRPYAKPKTKPTSICKLCGKEFWFYPYRLKDNPKYCSRKCSARSIIRKSGFKCPKGSLAKMGDKNPIRIHGIKPEHLRKLKDGAKRYQDSIRVTPEHKRRVKIICNFRREAKKRGNGGSFTIAQWYELKKNQNYQCLMCKKYEPEIKLSVDHIIPVSKGGSNNIENIQGLCLKCNLKKSDKIMEIK